MDTQTYQALCHRAKQDLTAFWAEQARSLDWMKPWHTVQSGNFTDSDIRWFEGGELNVCANCVDRHLPQHADKTAIIWEGDEPGHAKHITFAELHKEVCRFANVLKSRGIKKGDRVCLYMPMIPEAAFAMLACARIGAIHSVVFGGFSATALKSRVQDADACAVITAEYAHRGGKNHSFKQVVDEALTECANVHSVIVISEGDFTPTTEQEVDYHHVAQTVSTDCPAEPMSAEDPLFILYTSGSTGKPKGVVHTSAGYLLYASMTHRYAFDIQPDDIYWCTADVGWITGHSYVLYGPLANATTTLMHEGTPTYPSAERHWQIVDQHKVTVYYTSPTAIRMLMSLGNEPLQSSQRTSLRVLGSVGEPINPEAWQWYFEQVGKKRCPIVDTWWQTETGGFMIFPPTEVDKQKPGCATQPFPGIDLVLLDEKMNEIKGEGEGALCIRTPWPGMMRTVYQHHQRFMDTYLHPYPGYYFSGDEARRDKDGDIWISGRMDDVLNVSGHRLGTAEIESALVLHEDVAEAAVVGKPDDIKGESIVAFVTLMQGKHPSDALAKTLQNLVREQVGPLAKVETLYWCEDLPKTRSGKIMRRILRKLIKGQADELGDTSTLANPECVDQIKAKVEKAHTGPGES